MRLWYSLSSRRSRRESKPWMVMIELYDKSIVRSFGYCGRQPALLARSNTPSPSPSPPNSRQTAHVPCAGPLLPVCSYHGSPTHTHWSSGPQTVPPAMVISPCAQVSQRSRRQHTRPRHNGAAAPTHQELWRHRDACRSLLALVAFPTASCATTICAVTVTVGGATAGAATTPALPRTTPRP